MYVLSDILVGFHNSAWIYGWCDHDDVGSLANLATRKCEWNSELWTRCVIFTCLYPAHR